MKDQVDTLVGNGVPAALYNSTLARDEKTAVSAGLREGRYRLLYVSPERLVGEGSDGFLALLVAVRRAASWPWTKRTASASGGTTSGPSTGSSAACAQRLPGVSLHAYTATATARVRRDIAAQLGLAGSARARRLVRSAEPLYRVLARGSLKRQLLTSWRGIAARRASSTARRAGKSMRSPPG